MRVVWMTALVLITSCACGRGGGGGGGGTGTGGGGGGSAADCEAVRERVSQLYAAVSHPPDTKPEATATFVADNTGMVLAECVREPGRVVPCVKRVGTVQELESRCLAPLDDEGSEGDVFRTP